MSIVIFSREVRSGKTCELMTWVNKHENISGILMPDNNGKRAFYDIRQKEIFPAEMNREDEDAIAVGRYLFSKAGFSRANDILKRTMAENQAVIIIDEIGKLELTGEGFSEITSGLIALCGGSEKNLLLVVRDELLDAVLVHFDINHFQLVSTLDELNFSHIDQG